MRSIVDAGRQLEAQSRGTAMPIAAASASER